MKCISVPLTQQAMERLDYDCCKPGDLFEVVLNATDERALAETDIITLLNASLNICIDDFEDEGSDSNLLIVFYVQIMPDDLVMQLHRF